MKRSLALLFPLALVACQDTPQPTALDAPEAAFSRTSNTVDVIVALKSDFAPGAHADNRTRAAEIARDLGVSPRFAYGTALFGFAASVPEGRLNALRNDPRVAYVNFDKPMSLPSPRPMAPPWEGSGGSSGEVVPWGISRIGADANTNEGTGIHVYVIDTGIDADHGDLQANLGNGYAVETCKGGSCLADWDDDQGHGTHVAGTIGAIDNDADVIGVASQVTLHAVKVLDKRGSGSWSGVISGIDWVANETKTLGVATVANMSLGGSGSKTGTCDGNGFTGDDAMHQSICNATHMGVVFAVAAGNDGADAEASVPAAYDDAVITVSATMEGDDWTDWSNWGDNSASWTAHVSAPVAIAAPGASILSTAMGGGTTTKSGTSMASPHVAGAIALFLKSNPQANDGTAFSNTRAGLLSADESTDTWTNTSGNVHDEDFLNASGL